MPSTFFKLLRFGKSTAVEATENFTTEALASCIRSDPRPMLRLLERASVVASADEVSEVVVRTQVSYTGAGIIDLVLQLRLPDAFQEVWMELKVLAGESGRQLDNYRRFIDAQPLTAKPGLVTVSKSPIRL